MRRLIIILLLLLTCIPACYYGIKMVLNPSGNSLSLDSSWLVQGPFHSYFVPGILLLSVIGIGGLVSAILVIFFYNSYPYAVIASGSALVIWIITQYLLMSVTSFLQPAYATVGIVLVILGILEIRPKVAAS